MGVGEAPDFSYQRPTIEASEPHCQLLSQLSLFRTETRERVKESTCSWGTPGCGSFVRIHVCLHQTHSPSGIYSLRTGVQRPVSSNMPRDGALCFVLFFLALAKRRFDWLSAVVSVNDILVGCSAYPCQYPRSGEQQTYAASLISFLTHVHGMSGWTGDNNKTNCQDYAIGCLRLLLVQLG